MKIATWNVNSIKARKPRILDWFDEAKPDVCVLQEIKCVDEAFPTGDFEERGYNVFVYGQKTYNGVALLSKHPVEDVIKGLPNFEDDQARYIEGTIIPDDTDPIRVGGLYMPNGNPAPGPKWDYKLAFIEALIRHMEDRFSREEAFCVAGDYNIIPSADGVYDPKGWADDALFRPEVRAAFRRMKAIGFTSAVHALMQEPYYTFWDYQGGAWKKNHGLQIDHLLLSPEAADRLEEAGVDADVRDPETGNGDVKPSDHVPVWINIA
ncbi:exodeoxyribonuclease III [Parvularcula lutaonensis]|uniref:Exodeoxyribonuclease III n=1 Tax=Parvularcula lutaonensis TaxID=491923 RepID=A0ABV7MCP7_9PROT|nr:exodeoxyribonuclease III [Parvularcula lutaonensis]GGY39255.1 exodeoxyribonuclease III [Parvularcula lutaonensis]